MSNNMFWNEEKKKEKFEIPDDIVDVSFAIRCKCLPLEHMQALSQSLFKALPWLEDEPLAGIHPIYGAETGNGWERPSDPDELIFYSRRQKMTLRLPKERLQDVNALVDQTIQVAGYEISIGKATIKKLSDLPTTFSRAVLVDSAMEEEDFLQWAYEELKKLDIPVRKMMAGKERLVELADGSRQVTRSLMLAEMEQAESVRIQQY